VGWAIALLFFIACRAHLAYSVRGRILSQIHLERVSVEFPIYDANSRSLKKRVLAGTYETGAGTVCVECNVALLFDITLGMDPESTGYENIVLRGLYLGLSRDVIRERMPEIAEFTELGGFLDLPIRTYSEGKRMRLAFAVSTSRYPDVLLLDDGIGTGEPAVLEKANRRLQDFTNTAAIVILAPRSEQLVKQLCPTSVLMEHGRVIQLGETENVLTRYRGGSALGRV
jgi:homopolymeric O-antigen transport system ATP-binding protein